MKIKQYKGCDAEICRTRNKNSSDKSPSWFEGKQETNRNTKMKTEEDKENEQKKKKKK